MKANKLKASELRVGNITTMGVVSLIDQDVFRVVDSEGDSFKNTWAEINPISLTEELLLKFGFEHEDHYLELQIHEHLSIIYMGYLALMIDGVIIQVNNTNSDKLHQLQNLYFSLKGEELTPDETNKTLKCEKCGNSEGVEESECPYQLEINEEHVTCNCCEDCGRECCESI